jgi:hypothetical protein
MIFLLNPDDSEALSGTLNVSQIFIDIESFTRRKKNNLSTSFNSKTEERMRDKQFLFGEKEFIK